MVSLAARLGTFFYLIGGGLFVLFLGSEFSRQPDFNYFFLSLGMCCLGFLFRRRHGPRPESARFSSLRRARTSTRRQPGKHNDDQEQPPKE